jgi:hypothetical protein
MLNQKPASLFRFTEGLDDTPMLILQRFQFRHPPAKVLQLD